MQLVAGDHNIVKQEENKEFLITEEKNEHKRVAITSNLQTSEEFSVKLDLRKENVDVASEQQHVEKKATNSNASHDTCCHQLNT